MTKKTLTLFLLPFMVFSCTENTQPSSSSGKKDPELKEVTPVIDFDFDSHNKEYIINKATGEEEKVNYLFNESNAKNIFKAPSDPLFKTGVGESGTSLYLDGHSTRMRFKNVREPKNKLSISCWIAPRGFENVFDYDWNGIARGHTRLTSILNKGHIEDGEGFVFGYGRLGKWGLQMCLSNSVTGEDYMVGYYDPINNLELYQWNHIAVTYDGEAGYIGLFYNGVTVYEDYSEKLMNTSIISTGEDLLFGAYCSPMIEFSCERQLPAGLIDNFKMYRDVLTPKDVQNEYRLGCRFGGTHPELDFDDVKEDRAQYEGDRYRPIYHGIPSAVWMNEPHAPIYYKGMYHLFYQHNPIGPYWSQIRWAHWVSTDMIHWVGVKDAVAPTAGICPEGVWTGGSVIGPDGTPWLVITAGTNQSTWTGQNIAYAHCVDPDDPYLTDWVVEDKVVLTQPADDSMGEREQFRDPFVWYDDGLYYMMVSTSVPGRGGSANIYTSPNMRDWVHHGYLYECPFDRYPVQGAHWECVVMFPISSKDGSIKRWILFDCPQYTVDGFTVDCIYWVGQFDKKNCRFIPEDYKDCYGNWHDGNEPRLFDYGDGLYTGQTGFCYLTEEDKANGKTKYEDGRTVIIALAQGKAGSTGHNINAGWAHNLAMPVNVYLDTDGCTVLREAIPELSSAYDENLFEYNDEPLGVDAMNSLIKDIRGDSLEIKFKAKIKDNIESGLNVRYNKAEVEKTPIIFKDGGVVVDRLSSSELSYVIRTPSNFAPLNTNEYDVTILIDHSLIEVYVNGKITITTRVYPMYGNSDYLKFFTNGTDGMTISDVSIKSLGSVYFNETTPSYYGNTGNYGE